MNNQNTNQEQNLKILNIKQVFLKKCQFNAFANPLDYQNLKAMESLINININHEKRGEKEYLISLAIELEGFDDDKRANKLFHTLVEVCGLFEIGEFNSNERNLLFYGFCANTLFPFVRSHITSVLAESGFKSILLSPINFEHLYLSKLKQKQDEGIKKSENENSEKNNSSIQKTKIDQTNLKIH